MCFALKQSHYQASKVTSYVGTVSSCCHTIFSLHQGVLSRHHLMLPLHDLSSSHFPSCHLAILSSRHHDIFSSFTLCHLVQGNLIRHCAVCPKLRMAQIENYFPPSLEFHPFWQRHLSLIFSQTLLKVKSLTENNLNNFLIA